MYEDHWLGIGQSIGESLNGSDAALKFFTGYLIEESLSLDNMFVIALIFTYFAVPAMYQHRVLYWGILGAIVMRGAMIGAGTALIRQFSWMIYVFGAILLLTAVKLLMARSDNIEPERNPLVRLARRFYPVSAGFEREKFFTRVDGRLAITPLFLVLLEVESSNVFAILGLRSLYFVLAAVMSLFRYLKTSLVFVLAFVGVKMILSHHYPIPTSFSLSVVAGILAVGVAASLWAGRREAGRTVESAPGE
jgi:tellurite resistance protein TerC